jgi:hypothetical protein
MLALVDADSLIYKVGFAIEDKTYWNEAEVMAGIEQEKDITYDTNIAVCLHNTRPTCIKYCICNWL